MSVYKPTPAHNPLYAPAVCLCAECSRDMLARRCPATKDGVQCGDFKGHRGSHTMLPSTVFQIAMERAA